MKSLAALACALHLLGAFGARPELAPSTEQRTSPNWSKVRVLLYTKNGTGYVHDNIPASIEAIRALAAEHKFAVDVSDDPVVFSDDNLKKYHALVFSNTNNVVFETDAQRVALMRYVQAGGGFVAIHSASGTERAWKWFHGLLTQTDGDKVKVPQTPPALALEKSPS